MVRIEPDSPDARPIAFSIEVAPVNGPEFRGVTKNMAWPNCVGKRLVNLRECADPPKGGGQSLCCSDLIGARTFRLGRWPFGG